MEDSVKELETTVDTVTETNKMLLSAIQSLNSVMMVMAYNLVKDGKPVEIPEWKTREDMDKDIKPFVMKCIEQLKEVYGQRASDKG